ncbi:MAG: VOC family protein [Ramlibacter sp.]|nr:VOC family protein [Ramlibacter sp.]MCW5652052.1 VOC family protein [Ramlibacter sp.]
MTQPQARVDHLVVVAPDLATGVAWCERTLGVTPGPGGEHPLMGTHNRLLRIATVDFPRAYFEIIAINTGAAKDRPAGALRWFDMDSPQLQAHLDRHGPQLVHFVANTADVAASVAALHALGIDRGPALAASRPTPRGLLQWQITVREDGQRLFQGGLPTLIEWGQVHPASAMPESGVTLQSLTMHHPDAAALQAAHAAIGLQGVGVKPGPANLVACLRTPRGLVTLESRGL